MYCDRLEKPAKKEGNGILNIKIDYSKLDSSVTVSPDSTYVEAKSELRVYNGYTNEDGEISFNNLISGLYTISFNKIYLNNRYIGGGGSINIMSSQTVDTVFTAFLIEPGIKINEIFAAWSQNDILYYHDQFIELYNASDDTLYLDGMIIVRGGGNVQACSDIDNDGQLENFVHAWRFPGKPVSKLYNRTKGDYPIYPHQFVILATDARDHTEYVPNSVDLSHADWEFVNKKDYADYDTPSVPNIICLRDDYSSDFMYAGTSDIILLCTGEDAVPDENSKYPLGVEDGIAIETIIDGVEYQSSSTSLKTLDSRVDKGFTGVGINSYSGKSMQRIMPGFDTNNSSIDFKILLKPTPGYQE